MTFDYLEIAHITFSSSLSKLIFAAWLTESMACTTVKQYTSNLYESCQVLVSLPS